MLKYNDALQIFSQKNKINWLPIRINSEIIMQISLIYLVGFPWLPTASQAPSHYFSHFIKNYNKCLGSLCLNKLFITFPDISINKKTVKVIT